MIGLSVILMQVIAPVVNITTGSSVIVVATLRGGVVVWVERHDLC